MTKFALSIAVLLVSSGLAYATTAHLKGPAADAFISQYFPNADIPGPVSGRFVEKAGRGRRIGFARCNVPAMGARSDGEASTCTLTY